MAHQSDTPTQRKPSFFWWTIINLLAVTFAVLSWVGCYFIFNFPEKPWNYAVLKKLNRLPEISFFESSSLPKATTLPPKLLYGLIYERQTDESAASTLPALLNPATRQTLNIQLKRNYITNFKEPQNLNYVRGTWRILSIRELNKNDFISSGFAILAQALAIPADQENSTNPELFPFPVELEIILPTARGASIPNEALIEEENSFELTKLPHAFTILHITQSGTSDEPISRITAVPILGTPFPLTKETSIELTAPTELNTQGAFPLFSQD